VLVTIRHRFCSCRLYSVDIILSEFAIRGTRKNPVARIVGPSHSARDTRCRLLLPIIPVSVCVSVCLTRHSTRLHCAETSEQMLFGVNIPGGPWNIVLVLIPSEREGEGELGKILPTMDPLHISVDS